jgi:adenylate cyclase
VRLALAAVCGGVVGLGSHVYVARGGPGSALLENWELVLYDAHFGLRGNLPPSGRVCIIALDKDTPGETGYDRMPRDRHAQLLDDLREAGAAVVGFDLVFDLPTGVEATEATGEMAAYPEAGPEDQALIEAIRKWDGRVVLAADFQTKGKELYAAAQPILPLYEFEEPGATWGPVNLPLDRDDRVRRFYVARPLQSVFHASFATRAACTYSRVAPTPDASWDVSSWPVDSDSALLIHFLGQPGRSVPIYPYYQVVPPWGELSAEEFRGKIVLVGTTDPLAHDDYAVPLGRSGQEGTGDVAGRMPGVEVQANAIETLLSGSFIRVVPGPWQPLLPALFGVLGAVGTLGLRPTRALPVMLVPLAALGLVSHWLFVQHHLWLWTTMPSLALIVAFIGATVYSYATVERERRRIRNAWAQRAPRAVVEALIQNPELIEGGGRRLQATVLFSDLRDFTTMCHALPPEEVVAILNDYLARMTEVIHQHRGVIDKFIGDGIMAVFGAPEPDPDHARHAVLAALAMQEGMAALRDERAAAGREPLYMRVGVHTGELVAGDIGSEQRLEYTHIGDTVSVASRLEGLNKELGTEVLISEATLAAAQGAIAVEPFGSVSVRGRAEEIEVYRPLGPALGGASPPQPAADAGAPPSVGSPQPSEQEDGP